MINRSLHQSQETLARVADFSDEGGFEGCDGSGPCEEGSEHDHMKEEGEDEQLEGEGDLI